MTGSATILPDDLVSVAWLRDHLLEPALQVLDIRGYVNTEALGGGRQRATYTGALNEFQAAHIPGSVFIDWTRDIVDPESDVPAQIAGPQRFAAMLGLSGVDAGTDVVVVDHAGGHFATRLWWALRYYGHDRIAVLDGGFARWRDAGYPTEAGDSTTLPRTFVPVVRPELARDADDVLALIRGGGQIVDARDRETYDGAVQRGSRGGHIPGALNLPAKDLIGDDGSWKSPETIRETAQASGIDLEIPVTAYCNGGVTATAVLFGLHRAGARDFSNYDGSWNEWGEREDLPAEGNRDLWRQG
ncbi:MAG: sulfurtransferase [Chloroflexia bacterium]|nr:sulfurtransferase [Chloroflexia bacterium]